MRRSLPLLVLLLATAAACGQVENDTPPPRSDRTSDIVQRHRGGLRRAPTAKRPARPAPESTPTVAPDVAFDYRYAFRLAADRIAEVQEQHQQLCERYTLARCRITGMTYRAVNEDDVEAMLAFAVDPAIARQFGREARSSGSTPPRATLTESEISGTDVGTTIQLDRAQPRTARGRACPDRGPAARDEPGFRARNPSSTGRPESCAPQIRELRESQRGQSAIAGDHADPVPLRLRRLAPGEAEQPTSDRDRPGIRRGRALRPYHAAPGADRACTLGARRGPRLVRHPAASPPPVPGDARGGERNRLRTLPSAAPEGKGAGAIEAVPPPPRPPGLILARPGRAAHPPRPKWGQSPIKWGLSLFSAVRRTPRPARSARSRAFRRAASRGRRRSWAGCAGPSG